MGEIQIDSGSNDVEVLRGILNRVQRSHFTINE